MVPIEANKDVQQNADLTNKKTEKVLFEALRVYKEQGAFLHRMERFEEARKSYDEAYKNNPEDVDLLLRRSAACVDGLDSRQALQDAENALRLDPTNIKAILRKSRALASMCAFEHSVVHNYQGLKRRRKPSYFREGFNSGIRCIEESIGKVAGQVLAEYLPIIEAHQPMTLDEHEPETVKRPSRIPQLKRKTTRTQSEIHKHDLLARVLTYKYLGPLAYDKFFLQKLTDDQRVMSANTKGSQKLSMLIKEALTALDQRQEILREQRPYYSIKQSEKTESKHQNMFNKKLLRNERLTNTRNIEHMIWKVEACLISRNINQLMANAERTQLFLDSKTNYTLPEKDHFIERLYRAVGSGYLSQNRISYKLGERSNRRRIAFLMGIRVGRPTSFDSVIANFPYKFTDTKRAIERTKTILETCENATMECYLHYELARLSAAVKNYTQSKYYAKRCQLLAEKIDDPVWWLNGCFALISGDMQQGNVNEVKAMVEEAYEWAKKTKNPAPVRWFLFKCSQMVNDLTSSDDTKAIQLREQDILNSMDEGSREEAKHLFKKISAVPVGRRFSVLPRSEESKNVATSCRRGSLQRHISIVPGPGVNLQRTSNTPVRGFQVFET